MTQTTLQTIDQIIYFIQSVFANTKKRQAVIAVSGGIDSAVALTLLVQAMGKENISPYLLPYGDQDMSDATSICEWNGFTSESIIIHNIKVPSDSVISTIEDSYIDKIRIGNIMARVRMILLFDKAAQLNALVCGTENKSEHFLGYFTRFGDAASDLEPLSTLYKTDVRRVAVELELPSLFLDKSPSAGLWDQQTDEAELGFSYEVADQILRQLVDEERDYCDISVPSISSEIVDRVLHRVEQMAFKRLVPYSLISTHLNSKG